MAALKLPDLDIASSYPTEGPNGLELSNLNGRGVAIEFFLGEDVLSGEDGSTIPAQWASVDSGVYQANFPKDAKNSIHERFRQVLSDADKNKPSSLEHDWSGMEVLLDSIISVASSLEPRKTQPTW